jgi:uncharacterized membrane protein
MSYYVVFIVQIFLVGSLLVLLLSYQKTVFILTVLLDYIKSFM